MSRIKILRVLLIVSLLVIAGRLFQIQILEHGEWVAKASEAHTAEMTLPARRGEIYMMDGSKPVAVVMNSTVYTIIVDPMMADAEEVETNLNALARDYITADFGKVFENKMMRYYIVAKNVPYKIAKEIEKKEITGLWFKEGSARVYAEGQMASQLIGFVNMDGKGQYGIEGALNEELAGKDGVMKSIVDVNNVALSIGDENVQIAAEDGKNVLLTIDKNIQTGVEEILTRATSKAGENVHAAAVVMDPNSGEIMAMANVPTYNPAEYAKVKDGSAFVNYTTEVAYETASVCKTFTFATGMDLGVLTADTTYNNTGTVTVDGFTIHNVWQGQRGNVTIQTGFNYSLNTASVHALTLIGGKPGEITDEGRERLYDYYHNHFGLGLYTGVELAESTGIVREPNDGYAMNLTYANMTFGQGLNVTMTQVAAAVSAIMNGGVYHTPTVVKGYVEDEVVKEVDTRKERNSREGERVVSENTSVAMREMFYKGRSLMRTYGVDKPGYYIGGKTGTGQKIEEDGSYSDTETGDTIASYVGFGGAEGEDPAYVVMVKIWGDGHRFAGEDDARPLFNDVSNFLIDYLQIKPNL